MIYLCGNEIQFGVLFLVLLQQRIEACLFGVYPLVPNRLVYPELYPSDCLYTTQPQLVKRLKYICTRPKLFRLSRHEHFNKSNKHQSSSSPSHTGNNSTAAATTANSSVIPSKEEKMSASTCNTTTNNSRGEMEQRDNYFDKYKWSAVRQLFLDAFSVDI